MIDGAKGSSHRRREATRTPGVVEDPRRAGKRGRRRAGRGARSSLRMTWLGFPEPGTSITKIRSRDTHVLGKPGEMTQSNCGGRNRITLSTRQIADLKTPYPAA